MAPASTAKAVEYGLALDFPGAPETPHMVSGLEGEFVPGEVRSLDECEITGEFYEIERTKDDDGPPEGFRAEGLPPRPLEIAEAKKLNELDGVSLALMQREGADGKWKRVPRRSKAAGAKEGE